MLNGRYDYENFPPVQEDDFIIVSDYHDLPKGIIFYYGFEERPYQKVTKTKAWDGVDKAWSSYPSYQHHTVRVPRSLFHSFCNTRTFKYNNLDKGDLLLLALKYQQEWKM